MMKKIFAAAFAAMILLSTNVNAQTASTSKSDKVCANTGKQVCPNNGRGTCEFEGLELSEQQIAKLSDLKQKRRQAKEAYRDSVKADRQVAKERIAQDRKAMKEKLEADRRAYLKEVKQILGNDKYVVFLENQYVQQSGRPDKSIGKGGHAMKQGRKDIKGGKMDKRHFGDKASNSKAMVKSKAYSNVKANDKKKG